MLLDMLVILMDHVTVNHGSGLRTTMCQEDGICRLSTVSDVYRVLSKV